MPRFATRLSSWAGAIALYLLTKLNMLHINKKSKVRPDKDHSYEA